MPVVPSRARFSCVSCSVLEALLFTWMHGVYGKREGSDQQRYERLFVLASQEMHWSISSLDAQ
eukprot:scaffold482415_cov41-Prasinocladus_malaysianus.AAC.1